VILTPASTTNPKEESMTQATRPSIQDSIAAIRKLRNEVPEFNPHDADSKDKIEEFHLTIHGLVMVIQEEIGFETYEQTLKFIDQEIKNLASAEVA
jgi:hypothetical protein